MDFGKHLRTWVFMPRFPLDKDSSQGKWLATVQWKEKCQ